MRRAPLVTTLLLATACGAGSPPATGPGSGGAPHPVSVAGTWVLSIDSLKTYLGFYVWFDCRSASLTTLRLSQTDSTVTGTWDHGLILCPDTTATDLTGADSVTGGLVSGTHFYLTLKNFANTGGVQLSGTLDTAASPYTVGGAIDSVGGVFGGRWTATKRAPTGTLPLVYTVTGLGQLDSLTVDINGVRGQVVPPNATDSVAMLGGGLHVLQAYFPFGLCVLTSQYYRYVQVNEGSATAPVAYAATC